VFAGALLLPNVRISLGDAEVVIDVAAGIHDAIISVADGVTDHAESVCIDLFDRPS
jgi:actin-like ATPase involved in cell morphogenesis